MSFFFRTICCALLALPASAATYTLSNDRIHAEFGDRGLVAIEDGALKSTFQFTQDDFSLAASSLRVSSQNLPPGVVTQEKNRLIYRYQVSSYVIDVIYELRPGWRFVSKQISLTGASFRVKDVAVANLSLAEPAVETYVPKTRRPDLETKDHGVFLRFTGGRGLFALIQNPFVKFGSDKRRITLSYSPDMEWKPEYGPFTSDRACIGTYALTGVRLPSRMTPEWKLHTDDSADGMEPGEIEAVTECVRAFLVYRPQKPLRFFVGWCVNDYQIDAGTPAGRAEYKRVIDRAAELGAEYVLFAPANSAISRREDSVDDWSWEYVLWLGLGQKIRKGEWDPKSGAIPPSVKEMLEYARAKKVKLAAYVYPVLPFSQNPEWLVTGSKFHTKKQNASLGVRSLQDWLIENLQTFYRRTGIGGYAFDYTFLWYEGTSRYAQWWGWRRVMETLREKIPGIAIDGRQLYQEYGPWSWLAGSYPHPTGTDEQPESFVPFPDLHFDRVSADRQRYTAYRYRNFEFAPSEIVPGFIGHQSPRMVDDDNMPTTSFRARDWDYLGWKYSLLSSIATAGWNNVLNMIPARDPQEYKNFSAADKQWFRKWLDWADANREYLRHTRTILGQPAIGRVDGTSAIVKDRGYIFLFNPNYRQLAAEFKLDESIGLSGSGSFRLKEIYPREGRWLGEFNFGDRVSLPVEGTEALVFEIVPAPAAITQPIIQIGSGTAALTGGVLSVTGAQGPVGATEKLLIRIPAQANVNQVKVNGQTQLHAPMNDIIAVTLRFAGDVFSHSQQVGAYDPGFTGGTFTAAFRIPKRIIQQLSARKKAWPIPWTAEDLRTTWLAPERLLLYVHIAEPDDKMTLALKIDGAPVELQRAYSSIRVHAPSFVGFYADVSRLAPDKEHQLELELPQLAPGQFQGVFFDNVETEFTDALAAAQ